MNTQSSLKIKFSDCKNVKTVCENLPSNPDWKEIISKLSDKEVDFFVNNVRFIMENETHKVLASELENDLYMLGCYNASFIAENTKIPLVAIEKLQESEAFEALGVLISELTDLELFAKSAISVDGAGHFFNSYNGQISEEITINGIKWLVFDNQ